MDAKHDTKPVTGEAIRGALADCERARDDFHRYRHISSSTAEREYRRALERLYELVAAEHGMAVSAEAAE